MVGDDFCFGVVVMGFMGVVDVFVGVDMVSLIVEFVDEYGDVVVVCFCVESLGNDEVVFFVEKMVVFICVE